jgi:hypothetical protein
MILLEGFINWLLLEIKYYTEFVITFLRLEEIR